MAQLEKTMFREYDIRGRVSEKELNPESCQLIGRAFGSFLLKKGVKKLIVGFDAREYSPKLKEALIKGLLNTGCDVIEIGQVLTPIAYFAQHHLKIKGLAMVTASHNPNGWSGFKLGYDLDTTLLPNEIQEIYQIIEKEEFKIGKGRYKLYTNITQDYSEFIRKKIKIKRRLKVVVNTGNGTGGPIIPPILEKSGCEVIRQFCEIDFRFPHHEPNPAALDHLQALSEKVKENSADIGLGFDGDGDRLGTVDEKGQIVWPDRFLIILARQVLQEKPGGKIVFDVKCSRALPQEIKKAGGKPVMWKTGHSYIKQKAKQVGAVLAGERSGHIFYRYGYFAYDDAVFAALKLLEYLSSQKMSFSQIMLQTPQYFTSPTFHVDCPDEIKYQISEKLIQEFKKEYGEKRVIDISGARVEFDDGWGLVRPSSNVPALVLVFESKTKEGLERIKNIFRKKLAKYPEIGKEWHTN